MRAEWRVGQMATVRRTLSQSDFDRFAALSGDDNPIHVDPVFSARTKFGRTVAHGMYLYSLVCSVLGSRLPGPGTIQVEQELMFPQATFVDEEVEIRVEVTEVDGEAGLADLTTLVIHRDGGLGLQGRTLVCLPNLSSPPAAVLAARASRSRALLCSPTASPSYKGLTVGQFAETRRVFTLADLVEYADLTGDANPVVTDAGFAQRLGLAAPLLPGGLLGGLFSFLLGTRLPGPGTNYLKQRLEFLAPTCPEEELRATVGIVRLRPDKQLVNLRTLCTNPLGEPVCRGEALVMVSDVRVGMKVNSGGSPQACAADRESGT